MPDNSFPYTSFYLNFKLCQISGLSGFKYGTHWTTGLQSRYQSACKTSDTGTAGGHDNLGAFLMWSFIIRPYAVKEKSK